MKTGDRVTFHLPMVPELPVSMLACARHGRDPFGGVRRVQRRGVRPPDRRLAEQDPRDDGRLLPQRRADRPQGEGRRGDRGRARGGSRGREGAGLAAAPGPVRIAEPDGRGARLLRRRAARGLPRQAGRAGVDAGRGAAVPDVHERHDRPAEGLRSTRPAAICRTSPARRSTTRTSTPTTPTGALPTSAGSPATPTSSTGRWRSGRRASCTRACRRIRTPVGRGGSRRSSG